MAYSDFTLRELLRRFQLTLDERRDLYADVPPQEPGDLLKAQIEENVPLAVAIGTEKARSELIIMPIILEVRRLMHRTISIFSGVDFTVEARAGLSGVCDFIISRSPTQLLIMAPVMVIIEAKNEDIKRGIAQCGAAMVAAQRFNEREGAEIPIMYGAVTTGNQWKFLQLHGKTLTIDEPEYYIEHVDKILGILLHVVQGDRATASV